MQYGSHNANDVSAPSIIISFLNHEFPSYSI